MPDRLARTLAQRLREERKRRRLSLRRLAELSGLSTTTVHQIETGRGSPSLATLQALASALGVPLASLLDSGAPPPEAAILVRAGERAAVKTAGGRLERLAAGLPGQRLRGLVLHLDPGADTGPEPMAHAGQELIVCLSGSCLYEVAGRAYRLSAGDSLVLDSQRPHRAYNPGRRPARLLLALYASDEEPPGAQSHARTSR